MGKRTRWNKEKIINDLKIAYESCHETFSAAYLAKHHSKLNSAIYHHFGDLQNALNKSDIDYQVNKIIYWDYQKVKEYIETESGSNCLLLSEKYINYNEPLVIQCSCGDTFSTSLGYFKGNKKQQCDKCGLLGRTHEEFVNEIKELHEDKIKVLGKYIGIMFPIRFYCSDHGEFTTEPRKVLTNKFGCSRCSWEQMGEHLKKEKRNCDFCDSDNRVQEFYKTGANYCRKHYYQMKKYGEVINKSLKDKNDIIEYDDYAEIILINNNFEEVGRGLVSIDQLSMVRDYKWYLMSNGYIGSRTKGKHLLLHRLIMDVLDEDAEIDHINRIRHDCRTSNLRKCTHSQNAMNSSLSKLNTSGVTGVYYSERDNLWYAELNANNKKYRLGYSKNKEEVIKLRKEAEQKYFKEFTPDRSGIND